MPNPNLNLPFEIKFAVTNEMLDEIRGKAGTYKYAIIYPEPKVDKNWDYVLSNDAIGAAHSARGINPNAVVVEL